MNANKKAYRLYGLAAGFGIWQLFAILINHPLILPRLEDVAISIAFIVSSKNFVFTVGTTLFRIAITIAVDTIAAFLLGFAAGLSERFEASFAPFETGLRAVPTMGILLLSLIWFNSEITPIFVASLIVFPLLYRSVVNGIKNIDSRLLQLSAGFRVSFFRKLLNLYLPAIKPFTITAYSTALGLLVKVMVTAEVLSQPQNGIGTEFQIARAQLDTTSIFSWSMIVIAIAAVVEHIAKKLLAFNTSGSNTKLTKLTNASFDDASIEESATGICKTKPLSADVDVPMVSDSICHFESVSGAPLPDTAPTDTAGYIQPVSADRGASIHIEAISFGFNAVPLFEAYSLTLEAARIHCLLGRSGSGKTTLLFLIAGFLHPQQGHVRILPSDAVIGFVYQDIRLIPHLSAEENICYVLPAHYKKMEAQKLARYYLQLFGLQGFEHFLPHQLSGGMQRRVNLARALAYPCDILLLDEAFDALDTKTKKDAADIFFHFAKKRKQTVLCVTHDPLFTSWVTQNGGITLTAD